MSNDKNEGDLPPQDKETKSPPTPKQVVITHYGKRKPNPLDVPTEIMPTSPSQVVSSPVDVESGSSQPKIPLTGTGQDFEKKWQSTVMPPPLTPIDESLIGNETVLPEAQEGNHPPPPDEPKKPSSISYFNILTFIVFIILFSLIFSSRGKIKALETQTSRDQHSVIALSEDAKNTLTKMQQIHEQYQVDQKDLQTLKTKLENAQVHLKTLQGDNDWVLAQANYLAFMAHERLTAAKDLTTAITQLEASDERLNKLANPAFVGLRETIAKDIAKLKSHHAVNRVQLWEELGALNDKIKVLRFKTVNVPAATQTENKNRENIAKPEQNKNMSWRNALQYSWQEFKSLIRITKEKENPIPLMLTEQEQFEIIRTLQLLLAQAQWALLQGEGKIYSSSLQSIQTWISQYFEQNSEQIQVLNQLRALEDQKIDDPMPTISNSLQALSQAILQSQKQAENEAPLGKTE